MRDFFGMSPEPRFGMHDTYGAEVCQQALELIGKDCDPAMNVMPYIQIVLEAKRLGLKVSR